MFRCPICQNLIPKVILDFTRRKYVCEACCENIVTSEEAMGVYCGL